MLKWFMAYDRLTTIPSAFTAGSRLAIDFNIPELPAGEGGSIAIYFRGPGDIPDTDFSYGTDGDNFTIDVAGSITTNWTAGIWRYTIKHTDTAGAVDTIQTARIEILPDPEHLSTIEARTDNEIILSRLYELKKDMVLNPYKTIQFMDKIYSSHNLIELQDLIEKYEVRVKNEQLADANKKGINTQFDISVEFTEC